MTGPEMLIQTLVKALRLEPQVDKVREALDGNTIERFKAALATAERIDGRLARIETALGITTEGVEPGSSPAVLDGAVERPGNNPVQLRTGTNH